MESGQLEIMLNRRTQLSDQLGNPEVLDEAEGCCGELPQTPHSTPTTPHELHSCVGPNRPLVI